MIDLPDDDSLVVAELRRRADRLEGSPCAACGRRPCGHEILFGIALGFQDAPRCLSCLADALGHSRLELRDHLFAHIQRRACYRAVWQGANRRESYPPEARPLCLWGSDDASA